MNKDDQTTNKRNENKINERKTRRNEFDLKN